ncbi:unnamed protein product, partial [Ectocarpus sp. 12 AP-2014]
MRARGWRKVAEVVLLAVIVTHALLCPFTKVEESFNIQLSSDLCAFHRMDATKLASISCFCFFFAEGNPRPAGAPPRPGILRAFGWTHPSWHPSLASVFFLLKAIHDLLVHRQDLASYDHNDFPGVVPRTFLGAAVVAAVSSPFHAAVEAFFADLSTRLASQVAARLALGLLCWLAFRRFNSAVASRFGDAPAGWAAGVWALQFHLPFYMSRTLPNVFALCVVLLALQAWLRDNVPRALGLFTVATLVFRCDVVVLLGPLTLQLLLTGRVRPLDVIMAGLKWGIPSLVASFLLDSALWGRWVWPESQVLLFNTVANRSSEWGEMPFYWYFVSALPRALSGTALLIPIGLLRNPSRPLQLLRRPAAVEAIIDSQASFFFFLSSHVGRRRLQVFSYLLPGVAMVFLYSALPHKELRFIFPALPLFNLAAGVGMSKAVRRMLSAKANDNDDDDDSGGGRTRSNARCR